jgi:dTDP-4-dehydrorhamnose 3,5-epimerase
MISSILFTDVVFTPLPRIATAKGEVRHGLRASDAGFAGFGEAYFTEILPGAIQGWKRHRRMTLNLVVVSGTVRCVIHNGAGSWWAAYLISAEDAAPYGRLTVPPGLWMAFQGVGRSHNLLMNLASHEHDPTEMECCELAVFAEALPVTEYAPVPARSAPSTKRHAPAPAPDAYV